MASAMKTCALNTYLRSGIKTTDQRCSGQRKRPCFSSLGSRCWWRLYCLQRLYARQHEGRRKLLAIHLAIELSWGLEDAKPFKFSRQHLVAHTALTHGPHQRLLSHFLPGLPYCRGSRQRSSLVVSGWCPELRHGHGERQIQPPFYEFQSYTTESRNSVAAIPIRHPGNYFSTSMHNERPAKQHVMAALSQPTAIAKPGKPRPMDGWGGTA